MPVRVTTLGPRAFRVRVQDLLLKYPNPFTLAASSDFPAEMSSYTQYGDSETNANFHPNWELTPAFVGAHAALFPNANRIWMALPLSDRCFRLRFPAEVCWDNPYH
jgi:hypothetical protein